MALVDCPECKKLASDLAAACPHCGYPMAVVPERPANPWRDAGRAAGQPDSAEGAPAAPGGARPGGRPKVGRGGVTPAETLAFVLSAAIAVGALSALLGGGDRRREQPKGHSDRQAEAVAFCEGQMRARLKAPGSADFPWGVTATAVGNQAYVVSSYVDAHNSFGAELRTHYTCRAQYSGDDWSLIAMDVR